MSTISQADHTNRAGQIVVPNEFPTISAPYRVALVGEAPGATEVDEGKPFSGTSGDLLNRLLQVGGMRREACFVGNICRVRPPNNEISEFPWSGPEIQEGLATLKADLEVYKPNIVVLLGGTALHAFKTPDPITSWDKHRKKPHYSITSWRGSLFTANAVVPGVKCISTFHPAALLRVHDNISLVAYDMHRIRREGESPILDLPKRDIHVESNLLVILANLDRYLHQKPKLAVDIEGSVHGIKCISFCESPWQGIVIPFESMDGHSYWTMEQEFEIMKRVVRIADSLEIGKILQSGLYDRFVLAWSWNLLVRNQVEDTMFKTWEFMCEWDKGLEIQSSIYTRQPYYAQDIVMDKDAKSYWARLAGVPPKKFWLYCGLDSAVTYESSDVLDRTLKGSSVDHYRFNVSLLNPFLYMEYRGIRLNVKERDRRISQLQSDMVPLQQQINSIAGWDINVKSPPQVSKLLYEVLKLPLQYKRGAKPDEAGNRKTTTEYEAILNLAHSSRKPELMTLIRLQEMRKRASDLASLTVDQDNRIRFSYNPVGTTTGRVSCFACPTGSGTNGQTLSDSNDELFTNDVMKLGMRDLLMADEDHFMWQADLRGADAWTVAAHCARLGDHTMMDDLLAGMKIPRIMALIVLHGVGINALDRKTLIERCKEIDTNSHLYFSQKQTQHGTNYGMKPKTVALRVFLESYGEVYITETEAKRYQDAYLSRYRGIQRWHNWMREQLGKGFYYSATGHKRIFTGRKGSDETLRQILSDEPQQNTTYATNMAAVALWRDVDNRVTFENGKTILRNEPLHQVHDALIGQFHTKDKDWALGKIKSYFDNTLSIAGLPVKIPFDGKYGESWGKLKAGKIL